MGNLTDFIEQWEAERAAKQAMLATPPAPTATPIVAIHYGQRCPICGAGHWWRLSDKTGWHCAQCETPPKVEGLITAWSEFAAPTHVELKRLLSVHPPVLRCGVRTSEALAYAASSDYSHLISSRAIEWFAQSLLLRGKVKRADSRHSE